MAPKGNAAYDYRDWDFRGNTALPLELPQETKKKHKTKIKTGNKTKSSISLMFLSMAFCFGVAILLVIRSTYIAEMNFKVVSLEQKYQQEMKVNKELNVRLLKSVNLVTLEGIAAKKLKMKYPDVLKGISYLGVDDTKLIDNKDYRGYYNIADVQEKQILVRVREYVGSLTGILNN